MRCATLDALRARAASDPKAAIKEAAKQFEALFMQQLMKSMREATLASGMLDNAGTQIGTEMLDTQFATQMTGAARRPVRRDRAPARAPDRSRRHAAPDAGRRRRLAASAARRTGRAVRRSSGMPQRQVDFLRTHQQRPRRAEAETGIPATFMVAQAAHESGWGRREIRNADGSDVAQPVRHQGRRGLEGPGRRGHDHRSTSTARRAR